MPAPEAGPIPRRLLDQAFGTGPSVAALRRLTLTYLIAEVLAESRLERAAGEPDDAVRADAESSARALATMVDALGGALRQRLGVDLLGQLGGMVWAMGEERTDEAGDVPIDVDALLADLGLLADPLEPASLPTAPDASTSGDAEARQAVPGLAWRLLDRLRGGRRRPEEP